MPQAPDPRTIATPSGTPKLSDARAASTLPPPPAPVARDANPWPMPGSKAATSPRGRAPISVERSALPADPVRSSRHGLSRIVPFAIFLAVLGSIAAGALQAIERGDRFGAIVPLVVIGVAALSVWRARRRRRG
jgi:hypothetical protein